MSADSTKKTIVVALGVCAVCSVLVSTAAVGLKSMQEKNKKIDKITNILEAGGIEIGNGNPSEVFTEKIDPVVINMETGNTVSESDYPEGLNPENFSIKDMMANPNYSKGIPSDQDIAEIKRKPEYMVLYEVKNKEGNIEKYILPIVGKGLWSTMYGFLALNKDLHTVSGITFYEHGETPGLGGEVDNTKWKESWKGKTAFNDKGEPVLDVIKGKVDPSSPNADHQIDGLSGATITTRGLDKMIQFWLGDNGYGPFLKKLREEGNNEKV